MELPRCALAKRTPRVRKGKEIRRMIALAVFGLLAALLYTQPTMAQAKCCTDVHSGEPVARAWGANFVGQPGDGTTTQ
jgi:hypothetical protein